MLPIAMIAALAMQKIDEKNKQQKASNQAAAGIMSQRANDLGAQDYVGDAISKRAKIDEMEGEDYLGELMKYQEYLQKSGGSK